MGKRVICDYYASANHPVWGDGADEFDQRVLAVNAMYGWLYNKGYLKDAAMLFRTYVDGEETRAYFVVDAEDLLPYKQEMLDSGVEGAEIAVQWVFHEEVSPCRYSGGIQLGWTMKGYRSFELSEFQTDIASSWETLFVKTLTTPTVYEVRDTLDKHGVIAACIQAWSVGWDEGAIEVKSLCETCAKKNCVRRKIQTTPREHLCKKYAK